MGVRDTFGRGSRICLIPEGSTVTKNDILKLLNESNINTGNLKVKRYSLGDPFGKPWTKYLGSWCNRVKEQNGWSGPRYKLICTSRSQTLKKVVSRITKDRKNIYDLRFGEMFDIILRNYHVF